MEKLFESIMEGTPLVSEDELFNKIAKYEEMKANLKELEAEIAAEIPLLLGDKKSYKSEKLDIKITPDSIEKGVNSKLLHQRMLEDPELKDFCIENMEIEFKKPVSVLKSISLIRPELVEEIVVEKQKKGRVSFKTVKEKKEETN